MNVNVLKNRWVEIEDRLLQVTSILDELEEIHDGQEYFDVKSTKAYLLYEQELKTLNEEQKLIEKCGAMQVK